MNDSNNIEEQKRELLKKFLMYGGIFLVAIFIVVFNKTFDNTNKNKESTPSPSKTIEENETLKQISQINDNYYSMNVKLTLDDDAITLNYQKIDTVEVGEKKYHKEKTEYIKAQDKYYTLESGNYIENNNFIYFDFDKTFINIENIKKLLNSEGEYTKENIKDYNVVTYTYDLKDVIKIYNDYNNAGVISVGKGKVTLTSYYKNESLEYIEINTTDLYNLIENQDLSEVKYKITLTKEKEEDPSWILEELN